MSAKRFEAPSPLLSRLFWDVGSDRACGDWVCESCQEEEEHEYRYGKDGQIRRKRRKINMLIKIDNIVVSYILIIVFIHRWPGIIC